MKTTRFPVPSVGLPLASAILSLLLGLHAGAHDGGTTQLGLDANNNHLSDIFESLYQGVTDAESDPDNDGVSNKDEAAAGTHPQSSASFFHIGDISHSAGRVTVSWQSAAGKVYQVQGASKTNETWLTAGAPLRGTGESLTATLTPEFARMLVRVQVSDVDTDADGLTDWEEMQAGTDPMLYDSDGDGLTDREFVEAMMGEMSTLSVHPDTTWVHESGPGSSRFRVARHGGFLPMTAHFSIGGTAARGTDYNLSHDAIHFPAGVREVFISVTPIADAQLEDSETVILSLTPSSAWNAGDSTSATITILGQGLTGQYFNTSNTTYSNAANFDPAQLALTRVDPAVDFDWSKPEGTPPGSGTGTPDPSIIDDDQWTVRWTGFLYPRTSEAYQIHAIADRGVVVWVSRTPITSVPGNTTGARINQWTTTDPTTKYTASMLSGGAAVTAGEPLYFRVDYRDTGGFTNNAGIQLRWSAPGVPEEAIPSSAFSRDGFPGGAPVLTSPASAAGISGAPFTFQITATNAPTAYSVSGLPAGLTVDGTGLISGISAVAEGYYPLTVTASNAAGSDSGLLVLYMTTTGGSTTREVWNGVTGTGLAAVPFHTPPLSSDEVTSLESPDNAGDNFGERLRGYITAPATGLYTFFLTSDEDAEFWVSSSEEPAQRLKRAWVKGSVADGAWDTLPGQKSITMRMTAGRRYFFEVLRREITGTDHLAVAWLKPGQSDPAQKEIIPGWALTAWAPQANTASNGILYAATLTPQAGANTLGSGSALLLVNEARTEARLSYSFSNLTGPVNSGAHIHDSRTIQGQAARIIYDIDDYESDLYGNYPWVFEASTSHSVADIVDAVEGGYAYINLHTAAYPSGEIRGTFYPVGGSQFFTPPAAPAPAELTIPADPASAKKEIVRFLQQATFGARHDGDGVAPWDADSIEAVQSLGYAGWVNTQLAMPPGPDPETLNMASMPPSLVYSVPTTSRPAPNTPIQLYYGSGPFSSFIREYYLRYPRSSVDDDSTQDDEEIWRSWWALSVNSPDQLRHRMAFALSQILVVSEEGELDENARAISHYYDLMYYHGLGNFRTLLERITLSPAMGIYLDMLGNRKPNPATGYIPNENFAREILQLFSIGLIRLHPDGSAVLSSDGTPVFTYEQDNVVGFAHTFTGWNYPGTSSNKITAMTPRPADHDTGAKLLLEEAVIPAATPATAESCNAELAAALDIIFHHPNTGPFICRQLIQRMVTANPSPAYIYRVSSLFENDGSGVRGNLAAVAKAILLDPEARNQQPRAQTGYGHLKEPVLRSTQLLRAFRSFSHAERNFGDTVDLGVAICATQTNMDLTQPIPTTDFTINNVVTPYTVVDGFVLAAGNTILVKAQTNAAENGLYTFNGNSTLLTRADHADSAAELNQAWVKVIAGTDEAGWFRQTATVASVGTDAQTWAEVEAGNPRRRLWGMGNTDSGLTQTPLKSPTVFNFYEPHYVYLGHTGENGLYAPEFQITTETTVVNAGNWFYDLARYNNSNATTSAEPFTYGQGYDHGSPVRRDVKLDLTAERALAADSGALVDHIAALIMPGMMEPRLRTLLVDYLETLPEATDANRMRRIGEALYLISLTPEFTWQK
jgi:uncharacterized protein (DUF1800 family)